MIQYFLTLCVLHFIAVTESSLLQAGKKCIPTATVHGPCHDCVCTAEGVFHCQRRPCYAVDLNKSRKKEDCDADHLYREDKTFCTCSEEGFWRSDNCHENFRFLHPNTTMEPKKLRTNVECTPYMYYAVDCNICRCESNGYIAVESCTTRPCPHGHKADACNMGDILRTKEELCACSDINYYIDRLCIAINKRAIQNIAIHELGKLIYVGKSWRRVHEMNPEECDTEVVYTVDCNKCVCENSRLVCTTKICHLKRKTALRHEKASVKIKTEFESLRELRNLQDKCEPGIRYRYNCNTCECTKHGELICATMMCLEDFVLNKRALRGALSQVNATHFLPVLHDGEKCVEGMVYRQDCNTCKCTNGVLLCTKMACLGFMPHVEKESKKAKREKDMAPSMLVVSDEEFQSLPVLPHYAHQCVHRQKYRVDCNVCICNMNSNLICDKKLCIDPETTRNIEATKKSGQKCTTSFETDSCISCSCVNGLTDCEVKPKAECTSGRQVNMMQNRNTRLAYDFKKEECVPDTVYKEQCNKCYCQEDKTLRCTRKMCLNFVQTREFEAHRKLLLEKGL